MITVAVKAIARRRCDSRAPLTTKIGQCHRYSPYERRPICTSNGIDSAFFVSEFPDRTITAMINAEATVAAASQPVYNCSSATSTVAAIKPSVATDATATMSALIDRSTAIRPTAFSQGRHAHANAAPSSNPLERVSVLRYKKLIRVSSSATKASAVSAITAAAKSPITTAETRLGVRLFPRTKVNSTGHSTYHCSSTASDHRWRRMGSELAAKYGVSTAKICHQLEKYPIAGPTSRRKSLAESCAKNETATNVMSNMVSNAGISRRKRRIQNCLRSTFPLLRCSSIISDVIKKPLTTKNTSTPINPPGIHAMSA